MAKLNINGKVRDVQAEPDMPLLWVIREQVGLTGTKFGCGIAQCGACSVHINGEVQRSCSIRLSDVKPSDKIVTIEGLSPNGSHPVQKAWLAIDVPQCGYCQSGQIMAAAALLKKTPKPTDRDIDEAMTNICRCGTYQRIRVAVHMAAAALLKKKPKPTDKDIDDAMTNICRCGTYQRIREAVHVAAGTRPAPGTRQV